MKRIKKPRTDPLTRRKATSSALKLAPMGRIVNDKIKGAARADMMHNGLDWAEKPRATRSNPVTLAVTRKSMDSVAAISKEAGAMLTAVSGSAKLGDQTREAQDAQGR